MKTVTMKKVRQPIYPNAASTRYYLSRMLDWGLTVTTAAGAVAFFVFLLAL